MADKKISQETAAAALTGTETLLGVQGGGNAGVTVNQLLAFIQAQLGSKVIAAAAPGTVNTGNTTKNVLATIVIPAGAMGPNGQVIVDTLWSYTNNANAKTLGVDFGGTSYLQIAATTSLTTQAETRISNKAVASQVGMVNTGVGFQTSTGAKVTSAVDTSGNVNLTITAQCANAADTITLESYLVRVIYRP